MYDAVIYGATRFCVELASVTEFESEDIAMQRLPVFCFRFDAFDTSKLDCHHSADNYNDNECHRKCG